MDKKPDFDQYLRNKSEIPKDVPHGTALAAWDEHGSLAKSHVKNAHYFYDYGVRNKDQSAIDRAMRHAEKAKKYAKSYDDLIKSEWPRGYYKKEENQVHFHQKTGKTAVIQTPPHRAFGDDLLKNRENLTNKIKQGGEEKAKAHAQLKYLIKSVRGHGKSNLPEEVEQIDEISTKTALSYASKAGDSQDKLDTTTDVGHRKFWNRQKGQALALDKVHPSWKRIKAKIGTTKEDVDTARAAHAKAKELEDKGHEAERMGDQKKMRQTFAAMVQQKLKSKEAMKNSTVKEAAEPKPKSMVPQAKQDLKKTKELYKKVDAISKEMKNPGYDVNDRVNHFRLKKHIHDLYVKKRQDVASKAMNEEVELAEAGQDRDYHEFWAGRTSRRISLLKKSGKPIPEDLLRKLEKHRSALQKIRSGKEKQVAAEGVDFATAKSDRGNIKTYTKYVPQKDGSSVVKLIKRRAPRGEIKIGEAIDKTNMMQASIDKMVKMDPLAPKEKIKLPPSQGLKPIGGEDQVHPNMAEEMLNRLYESLSDKNKVKFMEKLETEEGKQQLIKFAEDQGF